MRMNFLSRITKRLMLDYSPLEHLVDHAKKVHETVSELSKALERYMGGEKISRSKISDLEHEADIVKQNIRNNLPRSDLLMPVARTDLLSFLWQQDQIADSSQAVANMLSLLLVDLSDDFCTQLKKLASRMLEGIDIYLKMVEVTSKTLTRSLTQQQIDKIWRLIEKVDLIEHRADQIERELIKLIYKDQKLDGFEKYHLIQVVRKTGDTIDYMENAAQYLRIMTSR